MSRLRRLLVSGRIFFVTCNLSRTRLPFTDDDWAALADAFTSVRRRRACLLLGYVFMPDHWHALLAPRAGDSLPRLMNAVKVASMRRINAHQGTREPLWQPRYYDHVVRNVKEYHDAIGYMHMNPIEKGLVDRPEEWLWSSFHCFGGTGAVPLEVDRVELPAEQTAPL
jgi:putative transposase